MPFSGLTLRFVIAYLVFFSTGSQAAAIPEEWDQPRQKIADAWQIRKEVISVGNDPIGAKQLEQIRKLQREYGFSSLPLISLSLLRELQERGATHHEERLQYAELFGPELPATAYFQCASPSGNRGFLNQVFSCVRGLRSTLVRSDGQLRLLSNLFFVLLSTFVLVGLVFLHFFLIRHGSLISRALSNTLKYVSPSGATFSIFLLSLATWLYIGWMGPLLILFFLLWRHLGGKERVTLVAFWLVALLLPIAMYAPALLIRYERGIVSTLERPLDGMFVAERATRLRRWISQNPKDAEALFTLGSIEKETGRLQSAEELFEKASTLRPNWHKPVVNLAAIAFIQQNPNRALSFLQKAISVNPQSVVANFNLGKIYLDQTRLDEAQTSLKRSKDLNATLFAELDRRSDATTASNFLIDESLSQEEILPRVWKLTPELTNDRNTLFRHYFPNLSPLMYWILLGFTLILSFLVNRKWPTADLTTESTPTDPRPQATSSLDIFDPNLSRAFKREYSPLHAFIEKFQERWCTFLVPGLHHLFREHFLRALFWTSLSIGLLVSLFGQHQSIGDPLALPDLPGFPFTTAMISLFGAIYIYEALRAFRS